jgi:hypothetical protein
VTVQRHNLGQEPGAFIRNALARRTLQTEGVAYLPLGVLDGEVIFRGGYPGRAALVRMLPLAEEVA